MENTNSNLFRSGFVAVVGRPNVGKSTLINALLGQKIAAISPRPQTTRRRQLGIFSSPQAQAIFIDTPGLHHPKHKLGEKMVQEALEVLADCDLILFIVDTSELPQDEDHLLAEHITQLEQPAKTLLVLNKIDLISPEQLVKRTTEFIQLLPEAEIHPVSALTNQHLAVLLDHLLESLPEGPEYYPPDQVTDLYEREITADLIRAAALLHLRDEVPHGIAVRIDQYIEREENGAYIQATLFIERESHKAIVIGQKGSMLKKIGITARQEIETMSGRKVYLELRVKVRKDWRNDEKALKLLGFSTNKK
jgi:GTPase